MCLTQIWTKYHALECLVDQINYVYVLKLLINRRRCVIDTLTQKYLMRWVSSSRINYSKVPACENINWWDSRNLLNNLIKTLFKNFQNSFGYSIIVVTFIFYYKIRKKREIVCVLNSWYVYLLNRISRD